MFGFGFGNVRWSGLRGGFNPLMTNPVLYLNADSGVTHSSGKVSQWSNLGSGTQNAVQVVGGNQPVFNASGFNDTGRAYIDTNGTAHFLDLGTEYSKLLEHTVITVWEADALNGTILYDRNVNNAASASIRHAITTKFRVGYGDDVSFRTWDSPNNAIINTSYIMFDTKTNNVAQNIMEINGVGQNPLTNAGGGTAINIIGTPRSLSIGRNGNSDSGYFNGKIAAIYIANRVVSTEEKTLLTNYFKTYYGIS